MKYRDWMVLGALLGGVSCTAVFGEAPAVVPQDTGRVTLQWSVDRSMDPAACASFGAAYAEIILYDRTGEPFAQAISPCEDFQVTIEIGEGDYTAEVTLVDEAQRAVSLTLPLEELRVVPETELMVEVDFPKRSAL